MQGWFIAMTARAALGLTLIGNASNEGAVHGAPGVIDYARFATCVTGPGVSVGIGCRPMDLDRDGDVDLIDFAAFQRRTPGGGADGPLFGNPEYRVGDAPRAVTAADFDDDGDIDLVLPNHGDGNVSVLLNQGNAVLDETKYDVGIRPIWTVVGDLDNDLALDIVSINEGSLFTNRRSFSILPGRRDGTFADDERRQAGDSPRNAALSDMNDDGLLDIAVVNVASISHVEVYANEGDFEFQKPVVRFYDSGSFFMRAADLDGDGDDDWAIVRWSENLVSVVNNVGLDVGFVYADYPVGVVPRTCAIGDLNGDGIPDLAVGNQGDVVQNIPGSVSVLFNDGAGNFGGRVDYSAGVGPWYVAIDDLDGDTDADLVVVNVNGQDVSVLHNLGDGTFGPEVRYTAGAAPRAVAVGDMDGDGYPDLAVSNTLSDNVSILLNRGDGTFLSDVLNPVGVGPWTVIVNDFNGDLDDDLVTANFNSGDLSILMGNGDGSFGTATGESAGPGSLSVASGDFDEDGDRDLAAVNFFGNNVTIHRNNGDGTFDLIGGLPAAVGPWSIQVADLNGDLHDDLVVADSGDFFPPGQTVSIYIGHGDGTFDARVPYMVGLAPTSVAIADYDGDSDLDLAVTNFSDSDVSILYNHGDGTFGAAFDYPVGVSPTFIAAGDLNGDRIIDLAVSAIGTPSDPSHAISVLINEGDGGFAPQVSYDAGLQPSALAIGDINGDGWVDVVTANTDDGNVSILLGHGDGTFVENALFGVGGEPSSVLAVDFDRDGDLDIATANNGGSSVSVLLNRLGRLGR